MRDDTPDLTVTHDAESVTIYLFGNQAVEMTLDEFKAIAKEVLGDD